LARCGGSVPLPPGPPTTPGRRSRSRAKRRRKRARARCPCHSGRDARATEGGCTGQPYAIVACLGTLPIEELMRRHRNHDLASYAMRVEESQGRRFPEPPHPFRNDYERDRDRIIHSRAFRRLENKTQVFTRRYSDHFRTRLTHTLEVAQISRTVARALQLNGDLVEALALAHDVGHPPFGHAGEAELNRLMTHFKDSFDHNLHALRIVEHFEQKYAGFPGLNLTFEVREGIIKHSREYDPALYPELAAYG